MDKTDNLSLGADNLYTITSWGNETDMGEWSTYTPITEPTITDIEVSGRKFAGNELTFTAKFAGFSGEPTVVYQVNGEEQPGNTFTPPSTSVYTVRAKATYGDDEYAEKEVDVLVQEKPEDITVKLLASSAAEKSWSEVAIYAKDDLGTLTPAWPGVKLEESKGWYSYTISNAGSGLAIVFNENTQFGKQTGDCSVYGSTCYELSATTDPNLFDLKEYKPVPVTVTVETSGYATIVTTNDLTVPSGVEVYGYTFDDLSGFMVPGDAITAGETLPSGKGYVVKASPGEYTFTGTSAAAGTTAKFASDLTGWTTDKPASEAGGTVYGLGIVEGKVGFYKFSGATIPAGKAVYVKSN